VLAPAIKATTFADGGPPPLVIGWFISAVRRCVIWDGCSIRICIDNLQHNQLKPYI